jgi:DNA-binding ferritin-like protein
MRQCSQGTFHTKSRRTASTDCCWIFWRVGLDNDASLLAGVRLHLAVQEVNEMSRNGSKAAAPATLETPAGFADDAVQALSASFTRLLADVFALCIKTKNFHWHVSGPHFRDYHLLLDDQGEQIFATTDAIAERVRKVGGTTIRSIAHIARCSACATTMRTTSALPTCWKNYAKTTSFWWHACARPTHFATRRATLPAQTFLRIGSTRVSAECGFYSRRPGTEPDRHPPVRGEGMLY